MSTPPTTTAPDSGSIPAHGVCCPFCRSVKVEVVDSVFIEEGEFNGKEYDQEGNADVWLCGDCKRGFADWTPLHKDKPGDADAHDTTKSVP